MNGYFTQYSDNGVILLVDPSGLPKAWSLVPAPMKSEVERAALVEEARRCLWLQGFWIEKERRLENSVFDRKGEKTTTEIVFRVCKTEDEAKFVTQKIAEILQVRLREKAT